MPSPSPSGEWDARAEEVGQLISQTLRQQLQLDFDQATIVSVEKVEWPNACLGVRVEGVMCAQVVTPGYKVVLEAQGERYEYHSDASGTNLVLAAAPTPEIPDAAVVWTGDSDSGCRAAILGSETVAFGLCGGALMGGKYARPDRVEAFTHFVETYAPFEAATPAGMVTFTGQGMTPASPAEQRMVAEWARLAELEAEVGRSGASYGLAVAWHREGGIAGFCDSLEVYLTGDAYAASCAEGAPQDLGRGRLTADQLEQLYAWIDELRAFEMEHTDNAVADAMVVRLVFSGAGSAEATEDDKQALQDLAAQLFAELGGAQGEDAAFAAWLKETLAARDYDQLQALMGETFAIAGWRSEGQFYSPTEGIEQLRNIYLGADTSLIFPEQDLVALLGGTDPLTMFGPDAHVVRAVYARGWGLEGGDEAVLFIAQRPDGTYYWYGVLFAEGGFGQ